MPSMSPARVIARTATAAVVGVSVGCTSLVGDGGYHVELQARSDGGAMESGSDGSDDGFLDASAPGSDAAVDATVASTDGSPSEGDAIESASDGSEDGLLDASALGGDAAVDATIASTDGSPDVGDASHVGSCDDSGTYSTVGGGCGSTTCAGTCQNGRCLMVLACGQNSPSYPIVDRGNVYWVNDPNNGPAPFQSAVMKVPLSGGTPVTLNSPQYQVYGLALDEANIYWTEWDGVPVTKLPLDGAPPVDLVSTTWGGPSGDMGAAVDGTGVYFALQNEGMVMRIPVDGGTPATIFSQVFPPEVIEDFVIDSANVYVSTMNLSLGSGSLLRVPLDGSAVTTLSSPVLQFLTTDGTSAYGGYDDSDAGAMILRVPADGGAATTLAARTSFPLVYSGFALDSSNLYWADGPGGHVLSVPLAGGAITTLASGQGWPQGVAVDGTSVYWTDWSPEAAIGTVMKVTPKY